MLFSLLFSSRRTLIAAGLAFFIFGTLSTNIFNINFDVAAPAAAAATTMNFTKISYNYTPQDLANGPIVFSTSSLTDLGGQELFKLTTGLGNTPNPVNGAVATTRVYAGNRGLLGSSAQERLVNTGFDGPGNPTPFPAQSFFDIFMDISLPDFAGNPTDNPAVIRDWRPNNLGSSGQDGIAIDLDLIDPTTGNDIPITVTVSIPDNQGLTFGPITPSFTPNFVAATPGGPPGTFSSFFDIFTELDATGPLDPNLPLFQISTSLNTPEPASLSLLTLSIPLLLKRRKK